MRPANAGNSNTASTTPAHVPLHGFGFDHNGNWGCSDCLGICNGPIIILRGSRSCLFQNILHNSRGSVDPESPALIPQSAACSGLHISSPGSSHPPQVAWHPGPPSLPCPPRPCSGGMAVSPCKPPSLVSPNLWRKTKNVRLARLRPLGHRVPGIFALKHCRKGVVSPIMSSFPIFKPATAHKQGKLGLSFAMCTKEHKAFIGKRPAASSNAGRLTGASRSVHHETLSCMKRRKRATQSTPRV